MKIRIGYVTNSSSTNFMILCKKELTAEYLYEKLGFGGKTIVKNQAMELCQNIVDGTADGLRWYDYTEINEGCVKAVFGDKAERIYKKGKRKGFFAYMGHTHNEDGTLTGFFTTDSFEIEERDFYLNARNCVW